LIYRSGTAEHASEEAGTVVVVTLLVGSWSALEQPLDDGDDDHADDCGRQHRDSNDTQHRQLMPGGGVDIDTPVGRRQAPVSGTVDALVVGGARAAEARHVTA